MHRSFATFQDDNDLLLAARRKAAERVVFDLCYRGTTAAPWAATDGSRHVRVRISRLRGLSADQALKELEESLKS